jgi:hypothetical protein
MMTKVLVSKDALRMDEAQGKRYSVFQEDSTNVILLVPEHEAEEVAARLDGYLDMSEGN